MTGPGPRPGFSAHVRAFAPAPGQPGGVSDTGVSFLAYPSGVGFGVSFNSGGLPPAPPPPTILDIRGTYLGSGTASVRLGSCLESSSELQNVGFSVILNIPSQTGSTFTGASATLTSNVGGFTTNVFNLQGNVDATGRIRNGTYNFLFKVNGVNDSSGDGTFQGQGTGGTLDLTFTSFDRLNAPFGGDPDTCITDGSMTINKQ